MGPLLADEDPQPMSEPLKALQTPTSEDVEIA